MHVGRHVSSVPLLWVSQRRREKNGTFMRTRRTSIWQGCTTKVSNNIIWGFKEEEET